MRTSYRLSFLHFSLLDLSEKFRCQPIYLRKKRMAQSFTDGLPSRLGFDQGKKAAGGDYYLEMCLWKHLCVQARSWCRLRVCFSMRVCIHAAVARRGPRGTTHTPASPCQPGRRGGPLGAFLLLSLPAGFAHWQDQGQDLAGRQTSEKAELLRFAALQGQLKCAASFLLFSSSHWEGGRMEIFSTVFPPGSSEPS